MLIDGMEEGISTLDELRNCNSSYISEAEYVNFILNNANSPIDIVRSFSELFFPRFVIYDGLPFNISFGCRELYSINLSKGMAVRDAYYWAHVTDVGGRFILSVSEADIIANHMCDGWNSILRKLKFSDFSFIKQVDDEEVLIFPNIL